MTAENCYGRDGKSASATFGHGVRHQIRASQDPAKTNVEVWEGCFPNPADSAFPRGYDRGVCFEKRSRQACRFTSKTQFEQVFRYTEETQAMAFRDGVIRIGDLGSHDP